MSDGVYWSIYRGDKQGTTENSCSLAGKTGNLYAVAKVQMEKEVGQTLAYFDYSILYSHNIVNIKIPIDNVFPLDCCCLPWK